MRISVLIIIFFLGITAFAHGEPDFNSLEERVFKSFYDGDLYGLYDNIENLLLACPGRPESILYYYDLARMPDIYGFERVRRTIETIIEKVEGLENLPDKNMYLLILNLELEKLLYSQNSSEAAEFSKKFNPVRRWSVSGPYNKYGDSDLDYPFMPEIASSAEPSAGIKNIQVPEPDGSLDFAGYLYPDRGVAYASASIKPGCPVKIRIYSGCSYKIFINGRETIKNDKGGTYRNCRIIRVWGADEISIMIKAYMDDESSFRVFVTDENDAVLDARPYDGMTSLSGFEWQEELDYPFGYFLGEAGENPAEAYLRLALYFDELGSPEAFKYYRRYLALREDPSIRYLFAYCMIEQSGGDAGSALYLDGWKMIESLSEGHPGFLPARHMKFRSLLKSKSFLEAYYTGRSLVSAGAKYLPLRADFADLLRYLGYEKEFLDEAVSISELFPFSAEPHYLSALYYKERNIQEATGRYRKCLDVEYSDDRLGQLIATYRKQGAYRDIISVIKNYRREEKFIKEMIDACIDSRQYKEARDLIFKGMVKSPDPYFDLKLGLVSYLEDIDPAMYWQKFLKASPSSFSAGDFFRYVNTGRIEDPFRELRDRDVSGRIIPWILSGDPGVSSEILYRSYIFVLNRDGGSRVFCEDVVYLNDEKAADRWGEYRVPFEGRIQPVRIRTYYDDGSYNDSYRIHSLNGESYITLSSLKEKSIIHFSYCLENPVTEPRGSMFFSVPFTEIQNFNEGLDRFDLKVIAPADMPLNFYFNRETAVASERSGDVIIYSASLKDLKKIQREDFSGSDLNSLPFFTFSTMDNLDDFIRWYGGLLGRPSGVDIGAIQDRLKGGDALSVVQRAYDYVSGEIDISGDAMFFPDRPADTLFTRKGTPEDRTVLAMSILSELGIRSYLAFCRSDDRPDAGTFVSPYNFSDILLYVPLEEGTGIWLDFSGRYRPCGSVSEGLVGTEAVVIVGTSYEIMRVSDTAGGRTASRFEINLDEDGNAVFDARIEFHGRNARFREEFINKNYNEDIINYYIGSIIPSVSIDEYEVADPEERESPFTLRAKGSSFGIAATGMNRLIFQPVLKESGIHKYIRYDSREYPLLILKPVEDRDEYIYRLPPIFNSFTLDKSCKLVNKFGWAEINIKKEKGSNVLSVVREVRVGKVKISPEEYAEFLDFCLKLRNLERENIFMGTSKN